jgi:hypothetical protein
MCPVNNKATVSRPKWAKEGVSLEQTLVMHQRIHGSIASQ